MEKSKELIDKLKLDFRLDRFKVKKLVERSDTLELAFILNKAQVTAFVCTFRKIGNEICLVALYPLFESGFTYYDYIRQNVELVNEEQK